MVEVSASFWSSSSIIVGGGNWRAKCSLNKTVWNELVVGFLDGLGLDMGCWLGNIWSLRPAGFTPAFGRAVCRLRGVFRDSRLKSVLKKSPYGEKAYLGG